MIAATVSLEFLADLHATHLAQIAGDPRVSKTSGVAPLCDEATVRTWAAKNLQHPRDEITFVIIVDHVVAGCAVLRKIDWQDRHAELSYWLGVAFWGKGIALVASEMLRDIAFECFGLAHLHAHYLRANNAPSGRILEKLGFLPDQSRSDQPVSGRFQHLAPDVWTFVTLSRARWQVGCAASSWAIHSKTERASSAHDR